MAKKASSTIWTVLGIGALVYFALKFLPGMTRGLGTLGRTGTAGTAMAGTVGNVGYGQGTGLLPISANYRTPNATVSTSGDLAAILKALLGQKGASAGGMAPTHATGGQSQSSAVKGNANGRGFAPNAGTNLLDGIANMQNGLAFDGSSIDSTVQGIYDSGAAQDLTTYTPDTGGTIDSVQGPQQFDFGTGGQAIDYSGMNGYFNGSGSTDSGTIDTVPNDVATFISPEDYSQTSFDGGGYSIGFSE